MGMRAAVFDDWVRRQMVQKLYRLYEYHSV